jgi:hypothetical protein
LPLGVFPIFVLGLYCKSFTYISPFFASCYSRWDDSRNQVCYNYTVRSIPYRLVTLVHLLIHLRSQAFSERSAHRHPGNDVQGWFEDCPRNLPTATD